MDQSSIPPTQRVDLFQCSNIIGKHTFCDQTVYDYHRSIHYCTKCIMTFGLRKYFNIFTKCFTCGVFFLKHYNYTSCGDCSRQTFDKRQIEESYIRRMYDFSVRQQIITERRKETTKFLDFLTSPILSWDLYCITHIEGQPSFEEMSDLDIEFQKFKYNMN